jgi:hypothetical protein
MPLPAPVREKCSEFAEKEAGKDLFVYEIIYRHCMRKTGWNAADRLIKTPIPNGGRQPAGGIAGCLENEESYLLS